MASSPVNPRQRRLSEASADEDFDSRIAAASSASLASMLGSRLERKSTKNNKKTPGPKPSMLKIRIYYLPDASELPVFRKTPLDQRIIQHTELGYGKFILHYILFLNWNFSRGVYTHNMRRFDMKAFAWLAFSFWFACVIPLRAHSMHDVWYEILCLWWVDFTFDAHGFNTKGRRKMVLMNLLVIETQVW